MLTNDQMKPDRFAKWAEYRRMVRNIDATLAMGGEVVLCTHTRQTRYTAKCAGMFKANKSGAYVQRGKSWDFIGWTAIHHFRPVEQQMKRRA